MASFSELLSDTLVGGQQQVADLENELAQWRNMRLEEALQVLTSDEARAILLEFGPLSPSPDAFMKLVNALWKLDHASA